MKRLLVLILFLIAGCKESTSPPMGVDQGEILTQTGVVAEMLEVESYTYIRLQSEGREAWIATLPVWVTPGDTIEFSGGIVMNDFFSDTLGRRFDSILFVENVRIVDGQAQTPANVATQPPGDPDLEPEREKTASIPAIEQAQDGSTISEIYADYADQEGQTVHFRARVVKVNSGILGKNWVTLEDGTGTAPNDQIVSTTLDTVSPGDLVDVTAVIKKDVNLGYGYEYALLLEEAEFILVE